MSSTACTTKPSRLPSSIGFVAQPMRARARSVKSWVSTISVAPLGRSPMLAFSAAGFIATRTSGRSPGVRMSWSAKCSWNDDTPASVPCGALISAGKLGSVDRSFPNNAVSAVNRSPVSCMPSPESPAIRMTTRSSCSTVLDMLVVASRQHGRRGYTARWVRRNPAILRSCTPSRPWPGSLSDSFFHGSTCHYGAAIGSLSYPGSTKAGQCLLCPASHTKMQSISVLR